MINLIHHSEDFNIEAEWHFFATSHGKNACDGIGGTVKRFLRHESLRRPDIELIATPTVSFDLVKQKFDTIHFNFRTNKDHKKEEKLLQDRFSAAITIKGTRSFHSYVSVGEHEIKFKIISNFYDYLSAIFKIM